MAGPTPGEFWISSDLSSSKPCCTEGLGGVSDDTGTVTGTLYRQGQRGEYRGLILTNGTEIHNRWTSPGPTGIGLAIGADSIGGTASGRLRVCARRVVTTARVTKSHVPLTAFGFQTRNGGI